MGNMFGLGSRPAIEPVQRGGGKTEGQGGSGEGGQASDTADRNIGPWRLVKLLGEGGFGEVHSVVHEDDDFPAVIKFSFAEPTKLRSLTFEAEILRRLRGRLLNVVQLIDYGTAYYDNKEVTFMVMEKVKTDPGQVLTAMRPDDKIDRAASTLNVIRFGMQLLRALYEMHAHGMLHRDIKPDNMGYLIEPRCNTPVLKLFDVGMVRLYTRNGLLRQPRSKPGFHGTKDYASERAQLGSEQSRVDDIYACLLTMVELLNADAHFPYPWWDRKAYNHPKLKAAILPAQYLLRNCPPAFYAIHAHLRALAYTPFECPRYDLLGKWLCRAHDEVSTGGMHCVPLPWPPRRLAEVNRLSAPHARQMLCELIDEPTDVSEPTQGKAQGKGKAKAQRSRKPTGKVSTAVGEQQLLRTVADRRAVHNKDAKQRAAECKRKPSAAPSEGLTQQPTGRVTGMATARHSGATRKPTKL